MVENTNENQNEESATRANEPGSAVTPSQPSSKEPQSKNPAGSAQSPTTSSRQKTDASDENWHDIECYIQNYNTIAEWIRFADTKAAVILTVSGAAAGFIIPTIHKVLVNDSTHLFPYWRTTVLVFFALYLFFFLLSNIAAFLCINPFRKKGSHPSLNHCDHFHPAAIAKKYSLDEFDRFKRDSIEGGSEILRNEIQVAILFDSHISNIKYSRVSLSLRLFAVSVLFGFLYYLSSQF